jgi:hypothetical protein
MARDHARILTSIWRDEDFRALPVDAQHTYLTAVSHDELSYCGRLDYRPGRLAALAHGNTAKKIEVAVTKLVRARYMVLDRDTEELLIRTYVKHDGVLDRVNMGKAVARATTKLVSLPLRAALFNELGNLYSEKPHLAGWTGFADLNPDDFARVCAMSSTIPFPIESKEA